MLVIGAPSASWLIALQDAGAKVVHVLARDAAQVTALRGALQAEKRYGTISVVSWDGQALPHTNDFVDRIIVANPDITPTRSRNKKESLAPLGTALIAPEQGQEIAWRQLANRQQSMAK